MSYFYDLKQNAFLMQGLHTIPADAVPVKETEYHLLINGRAAGKEILVIDGNLSLTSKRPSQYHSHNGKEWVINAEQQAVKKSEEIAIMREKINALRDEKSAGGVYIESLGKWFDSDSKAQAKLLGLKATIDLVGSDMTVSWTCADNTEFENFGKSQLTAVIAAILQTENHNHSVARKHKKALEQADNPLEYDYSKGWSKTYSDYLAEQEISNE